MAKYRLTKKGKNIIIGLSLISVLVPIFTIYNRDIEKNDDKNSVGHFVISLTNKGVFNKNPEILYKDKTKVLSIGFEKDDYNILEDYFNSLDNIVETLKLRENLVAYVEGYVADFPSGEYTSFGKELSFNRASVIRDYLEKKDVRPEQISVEGLGIKNQVATNDVENSAKQNRRADIYLKLKS